LSVRDRIFKDASLYSVSAYVSVIFGALKGFFLRAILGPATYGLFSTFQVILSYAKNADFGLLSAIEREIPYFISKREIEKVESLRNTSFTFIHSLLLLVIAVIFLLTFISVEKTSIFIKGFRIVLLIIFFQQLYFYYISLLRSEKKFSILSKTTVIFAVFSAFSSVILGLKYKLTGVLSSFIISYLITIVYINMKSTYKIRFRVDKNSLSQLFKIGFALLIIGVQYMTLTNIDQITIILFLGRTNLGYYSIAFMVSTFIMYFPNAIAGIMFPNFLAKYGENDNIQDLKKYMVQPTLIFAYFMPILIGCTYIVIEPLIKLTLNKYIPGIASAKILILGSFFLAVAYMAGHLLVTLKKFKEYMKIQRYVVVMTVLLNILFVKLGWGIEGVAYATSIGFFLYATSMIYYAFKQYSNEIKEFIKYIAEIYIPFGYMLILLSITGLFSKISNGFNEWITTSGMLILFSILSIPLVLRANKKTGIIDVFMNTLGRRYLL